MSKPNQPRGRYRFQGGEPLDPNTGVHPEMVVGEDAAQHHPYGSSEEPTPGWAGAGNLNRVVLEITISQLKRALISARINIRRVRSMGPKCHAPVD